MHGACTAHALPARRSLEAPPSRGADLTVRLARDGRDLEAAQKLRFEVFNKELRMGLPVSVATGLDQDIYDGYCDHLLVIDNDAGGVVGTYRLLPASRRPSFGFSSESEFELENIRRSGLNLLELGRSCVAPAYRTGRVIARLFEAIGEYAMAHGTEALIGCASIHGNDASFIRKADAYLNSHHYAGSRYHVLPRRGYDIPGLAQGSEETDAGFFETLPPLFKAYLRLGAKVCGPPAYDRQFGTTDFLILAIVDGIDPRYRRRFFGGGRNVKAC
jgi:putative hemolysin